MFLLLIFPEEKETKKGQKENVRRFFYAQPVFKIGKRKLNINWIE